MLMTVAGVYEPLPLHLLQDSLGPGPFFQKFLGYSAFWILFFPHYISYTGLFGLWIFLPMIKSVTYVFGPWSYTCEQCCGSFNNQAKIVRKTFIPTVLWLLFYFSSLKNDVNVPSKSNKQKNFEQNSFLLISWRSMTKIAGSGSGSESGSISQMHGSADPDPDPHQNVIDPQHCLNFMFVTWLLGPVP